MMTTEKQSQLFATTLTGRYDDDLPWKAVSELRTNGNRSIFEEAEKWCQSDDPIKRARGCDILCQLRASRTEEQINNGTPAEPIFVDESFQILSRMLEDESDENALSSELSGLGHLNHEDSAILLVPFAKHANSEVRFSAACALGNFVSDPVAIETLSYLADDPDGDIRNWSIFALASQSDLDTPKLREIFFHHLNDSHSDAKEEAIAGLAKRGDARAVLPLLDLMQSDSYSAHHYYDFIALLDIEPNGEELGMDDIIDALYIKYAHLLPDRN